MAPSSREKRIMRLGQLKREFGPVGFPVQFGAE